MKVRDRIGLIAFALGLGLPGWALPGSEIPAAFQAEAQRHGIPPAYLYAVALHESAFEIKDVGRRPYPWVLNVAGTAEWFSSEEETVKRLETLIANNETNVDVGLMQINWSWHGTRFRSPAEAVDPYRNVAIGAEILRGFWDEKGDLWRGVGRYHSNTDEIARQYLERFGRSLTEVMLEFNLGSTQ